MVPGSEDASRHTISRQERHLIDSDRPTAKDRNQSPGAARRARFNARRTIRAARLDLGSEPVTLTIRFGQCWEIGTGDRQLWNAGSRWGVLFQLHLDNPADPSRNSNMHIVIVLSADFTCVADLPDSPAIEPNSSIANLCHRSGAVRDKQYGGAAVADVTDPPHAFVDEISVARGQRLVDDEDVGLDTDRRRGGQPRLHAARIGFEWL